MLPILFTLLLLAGSSQAEELGPADVPGPETAPSPPALALQSDHALVAWKSRKGLGIAVAKADDRVLVKTWIRAPVAGYPATAPWRGERDLATFVLTVPLMTPEGPRIDVDLVEYKDNVCAVLWTGLSVRGDAAVPVRVDDSTFVLVYRCDGKLRVRVFGNVDGVWRWITDEQGQPVELELFTPGPVERFSVSVAGRPVTTYLLVAYETPVGTEVVAVNLPDPAHPTIDGAPITVPGTRPVLLDNVLAYVGTDGIHAALLVRGTTWKVASDVKVADVTDVLPAIVSYGINRYLIVYGGSELRAAEVRVEGTRLEVVREGTLIKKPGYSPTGVGVVRTTERSLEVAGVILAFYARDGEPTVHVEYSEGLGRPTQHRRRPVWIVSLLLAASIGAYVGLKLPVYGQFLWLIISRARREVPKHDP
ncbi:hypothetical protein [Methanopyrus sp. KOL6]|uniref:hypothetical protein n=1 Tax=Methanopyrus sp. KOL6 TaxID=1937004 RepID=UPI000B4BD236|nr:hypothetical protein [Methanopyrus sp. KOL6]